MLKNCCRSNCVFIIVFLSVFSIVNSCAGRYFRQLDNEHKHRSHRDWQNKRNTALNEIAYRAEHQLPQERRDYDRYDKQAWKSERVVTFQDPDVQNPAAMYK